jgi:hypothetical protein
MTPLALLRLEGAVVLAAAVYAYSWSRGSWLLFALLFLAPDLSMDGYLIDAGAGSIAYNAIHTYAGPLLLAAYSMVTDHRTALLISLIWISHIGFDRLLGYGLKYPTQFKDTHLNPTRHNTR